MPATDLSPNVDNYFVGTGIVSWAAGGNANGYVDLGNVSKFEFTTAVTRLKHYSSRAGARIKDADVITQVDASIALTMDEFTAKNLALVMLAVETPGGGTDGDAAPSMLNLGTNIEITGAIRLVGTNDIGARIQLDLPNISITPQGALGFINQGTWGEIQLVAEVNADPTTGSLGRLAWGITGMETPIAYP